MAHAFTRVTLIGSERHADLLLPSDQPVGTLVPQILELLDDSPAQSVAEKRLVAPDGEPLSDTATLSDAGVLDGTVLTLFSNSEAPPPAVIYDVTDAVVEESASSRGRWSGIHQRVAGIIFAALAVTSGTAVLASYAGHNSWGVMLVAAAILLVAGIPFGRLRGSADLGLTLFGAGWLTALLGLFIAPLPLAQRALAAAVATAVTLVAIALASTRPKALYSAAVLVAVLAAVWAAAGLWTGDAGKAASLATLLSLLVLGTLPKLALSASGLAALDDKRANGATIRRLNALDAIASAHQALALGTVVCCVSIAAGLWFLGAVHSATPWSQLLLVALTLATALRARSFPLAVERFSLYLAASVGLLSLSLAALTTWAGAAWAVGLVLLLVAAGTLAKLLMPLPDHVHARFRLQANRIESLALLAAVPLTVGMFGIFAQLLKSFG